MFNKQYRSFIRQKMSSEIISDVSHKIPGWFDHIIGWSEECFHAQDKDGHVWRIQYNGSCYCEETDESR